MAPVLAIADLVADRFLIDADRDPVGETSTPIATGPPLVSHTRGAPGWGQEYVDKGIQYYEERHREQQIRLLKKRAAKLGLLVV